MPANFRTFFDSKSLDVLFFYFGLFSTCKKEGNSKMWHIYFQYLDIIINYCKIVHSMARANLNKSEKFLTNTTAASKYIPRRPRICINWNPPFQTKNYLVKVPLKVLWCNIYFIKNSFWKFSERADFNWYRFWVVNLWGKRFKLHN